MIYDDEQSEISWNNVENDLGLNLTISEDDRNHLDQKNKIKTNRKSIETRTRIEKTTFNLEHLQKMFFFEIQRFTRMYLKENVNNKRISTCIDEEE